MDLSTILNAELSTVGGWIADGWRWWLSELAAMVPERLRGRGGRNEVILLPPDVTHPHWRRRDRHGEAMLAPGTAQRGTAALPEAAVLTRSLPLPALPDADLRRLVALDIDRLTPFAEDQVWIDVEAGPRDQLGRSMVTLAVLPRAVAAEVLADAERFDVTITRLAAQHGGGIRFDFLKVMRGRTGLSIAARWWIAVAVLFAINLGALVIRDVASVNRLREAVEAEAPAARSATALRNRVMREQVRRTGLVQLRRRHDPLPVLARVTEVLPPGAWVMRLVWNGRTVRLTGYQPQGSDVLAALRHAPGFARVRTSTSDIPPEAGAARPFDITADVRVTR